MIKAALYLRVSTGDQFTENQRTALMEVAAHRGWEVVKVYEDAGISGAKGRDKRPGLDSMLKDAARAKFSVVMAWSVDRLGRSLPDLLAVMQDLSGARVDLFLHQQALDTTTPSGRAMFGMLGIFAEFERAMIQSRVKAGLERAKAKGVILGRPRISDEKDSKVRQLLTDGVGILKAAKLAGVGTATAQRIAAEIRAA